MSSKAHEKLAGYHKKSKKSKKGHKRHPHAIHIRRAANGSFIAEHHFSPDDQGNTPPMEEHTLPDVGMLQDHVGQEMGAPENPEQTPEPAPQPAPQPGQDQMVTGAV
jgi:hypothetical protein